MDCVKYYNELLGSCGCNTLKELDVEEEINDIAKRRPNIESSKNRCYFIAYI